MDQLDEGFIKEQAAFWLNSTLNQLGEELIELARQGVETYGEPVAGLFGEILWNWRQGRDAFAARDYPQALRMAQATQVALGDIEDMKSRYPYRGRAKEEASLAAAPPTSG
jgi:hypothetical protein